MTILFYDIHTTSSINKCATFVYLVDRRGETMNIALVFLTVCTIH